MFWRCAAGCAAAILAGAASWVDPSPVGYGEADLAHASRSGPAAIRLGPQASDQAESSAPDAGVRVAQWRFGDRLESAAGRPSSLNFTAGQPIYLSMTLDGTQAAIDDMKANHSLTIQVHWVRDPTGAGNGAPDLVTALTIGRPDLAEALDREVRRKGFFQWHSWARKDTLSPGNWTVSLTYPDGRILPCGQDEQPCRFQLKVG
jgi:hypothetical protein